MIHRITINDLMKVPETIPFLDVRTPAEFAQGHIPGAFNLPLFSNEERVKVGTIYKQESREAAILSGFDLCGTKWSGFIREALRIAPGKKVVVHCWRGGMRSGAMAWALDLYGFDVYLLEGGYKSYRHWVQGQFKAPYRLWIIGGMTGSGKTRILRRLRSMNEQVIDLEDLAQHQGSSYGSLNKLIQPSQEQFENNFAGQLAGFDTQLSIWVEDESVTIGKRLIPEPFWGQMQSAFLFDLRVPPEQRIQSLVLEYGSLDKAFLVECTERIRKRLGLLQARYAISAIREDRLSDFIRLVLVYYDKTYRLCLGQRQPGLIIPIEITTVEADGNARQILDTAKTIPLATKTIPLTTNTNS